ncbi:hypothetical protein MtrunA17_Chr2g0291991 [Medicago truncatula]|uniref:DUF674 family protein n=1 Tax=Medicago truncatula TaxID=3880 RepID=A0A396J8S3_MEDTR|nr:hypothetical protein MtrunA17_Chr2g0291991 [Medicago truncatula]
MPNVFGTIIHLLQVLEVTNVSTVVEQIVAISKKEVVDILKLSLVSKTPLTDFILKKKHFYDEFEKKKNQFEFNNGEETSEESRQMIVKVLQRKSTGEFLFVEGGVDFIDFLFSFLTFPL